MEFAAAPGFVSIWQYLWSALVGRLRIGQLPAKLKFQSVMQFDQVLRQLNAAALIGVELEGHAVTNGHMATRTVLAALRTVPGVSIRLVSLDKSLV